MNFVFDLDETLVATKVANFEAYLACGIVPPEDFWKVRWETWCSKEQHDRKQANFLRELYMYGNLLPVFQILRHNSGEIITNASDQSVEIVLTVFPSLRHFPMFNNMNHDKKIALLNNRSPGVYWDDDSEFVARVRKETKWQAIDVSGL